MRFSSHFSRLRKVIFYLCNKHVYKVSQLKPQRFCVLWLFQQKTEKIEFKTNMEKNAKLNAELYLVV